MIRMANSASPFPFATAPILAPLLALALSACATVEESPAPAIASDPVTVKIVGLNDFHGNIEPLRRPLQVTDNTGKQHEISTAGAAYLGTAVANYRDAGDYGLVIAAGDLIGGSPLSSSIFLDEPAIGAMNRIGLDFNAVGNHEFDRGWRELERIQQGGCEQHTLREPCVVEPDYAGAEFRFLAANVVQADGDTLFPGYGVRRFGEGESEVAIAVIGLTLKETPTLVTPSGVAGLDFTDEAAAINALIPEIEKQNVDAIVVSIHQGMYTEVGYNDKSCGGVSGPLIDILKKVDPRVDLVISGHTHRAYVCDFTDIDPSRRFLVTSAGYGGSMLTDITLTIDPVAGKVLRKTADNIVVQNAGDQSDDAFPKFAADPEIAAYVATYVAASRDAALRRVGKLPSEAVKMGPTDETALGNLIADAQLYATRDAGAQIAFMNNSGIRTPLTPDADGAITFGDIYAAQPFGNTLITKSFSGRQLLALLEQQFDEEGFVQTFSPSQGFVMRYDLSRPIGERVVSVTLDGQPINEGTTYRVTMNSFLAAGGDSFTMFEQGTEVVTGPLDLDAMEAYLARTDITPLPELGRVVRIGE